MTEIGIIGCGAIGTLIAKAVESHIIKCDRLILYDYNPERAKSLKESLVFPASVVKSLNELIKSKPTVILEAASQQAAKDLIEKTSAKSIEIVIMSVGALLELHTESNKIHIPSGAIGGLDAIASASLAGIDEVILTSRKNPAVLDMDNQEEKLVYEGAAEEAVRRFPREMNVAATLALHVKPKQVHVKVISDPRADRNIHEIMVKWKYGEMLFKFHNDPHPMNPKTSALAAWSAISLLKSILEKKP